MKTYTEEETRDMIDEAVAETEKSFGGTFKRLKCENEELQARLEASAAEGEERRVVLEKRLGDLERKLADTRRNSTSLAVRNAVLRAAAEHAPVPERYVDFNSVAYDDDPEVMRAAAIEAVGAARSEFEQSLADLGIDAGREKKAGANPTNPAARDTGALRDHRRMEAKEALNDMKRRGQLRVGVGVG